MHLSSPALPPASQLTGNETQPHVGERIANLSQVAGLGPCSDAQISIAALLRENCPRVARALIDRKFL